MFFNHSEELRHARDTRCEHVIALDTTKNPIKFQVSHGSRCVCVLVVRVFESNESKRK